MKRLSRIKGGRRRKTGGFHPIVAKRLELWARKYDSSESRAIIEIVSAFFRFKEE